MDGLKKLMGKCQACGQLIEDCPVKGQHYVSDSDRYQEREVWDKNDLKVVNK